MRWILPPCLALLSLIASTAMVRGAVLVTRNIKDFETLGLHIVNPFST